MTTGKQRETEDRDWEKIYVSNAYYFLQKGPTSKYPFRMSKSMT
jgi:hypothetical protein